MRSIIVAYDKKRGIGAANDMMWMGEMPAELRHFREVTMNSTLIMGRKTYESIGHPLRGREIIVISRDVQPMAGVRVVSGLEQAYSAVETENVFIAGGGQIYSLALDTVDQVLATEIDEVFPAAEIFFPSLEPSEWVEVSREHHDHDEDNKYDMDFVVYDRTPR